MRESKVPADNFLQFLFIPRIQIRLKEDSILYFLKGATYIFININWFQISVRIVKMNSANPREIDGNVFIQEVKIILRL